LHLISEHIINYSRVTITPVVCIVDVYKTLINVMQSAW